MEQAKSSWRIDEKFHSQEFYLKDNYLLHKDWFDPNKSSNIHKISFKDILTGKLDSHFMITLDIESWIYKEIKENIKNKLRNE